MTDLSIKSNRSTTLSLRSLLNALGMVPVMLIIAFLLQVLSGYNGENGFVDAMISGRFLTFQNLSIITQQASINIVLAAGMTFVILTGGIDLSVGSILACSAVVAVLLSLSPELAWAAVPLSILFGLGLGLVNGLLVAGLQLPPFIVTLGSLTAVRGLARLLADDKTIFNQDMPFAGIGNGHMLGVSWLAIIALSVVGISWLILTRTVLGVYIYAIGGNQAAAKLAGIKTAAVLLFVYCASGMLSGLGGVMASSRLYAANGLQLGQSYELDAIAAVILGGVSFVGGIGSIWGVLIGALLIAMLSNGLIIIGVSDIWQYIIKGFVIVGAVTLDRYRMSNN